jgi:hypothetical protein
MKAPVVPQFGLVANALARILASVDGQYWGATVTLVGAKANGSFPPQCRPISTYARQT